MNSKNVIVNVKIAGSLAAALTMVAAPVRRPEAAATHHGQVLRYRVEGRQ